MKPNSPSQSNLDDWTLSYLAKNGSLIIKSGPTSLGKRIHLEDIYGRILMHQRINDAQTKFEIGFLPQGMYWVYIEDHGSQKWTKD